MESIVTEELWEEPTIRPDAILDVPVRVAIEIGRVRLSLKRLLRLNTGAVLQFERTVAEPMELLINGVRFARGEVIMVNGEFGFRLTHILNDYSAPPGDRKCFGVLPGNGS